MCSTSFAIICLLVCTVFSAPIPAFNDTSLPAALNALVGTEHDLAVNPAVTKVSSDTLVRRDLQTVQEAWLKRGKKIEGLRAIYSLPGGFRGCAAVIKQIPFMGNTYTIETTRAEVTYTMAVDQFLAWGTSTLSVMKKGTPEADKSQYKGSAYIVMKDMGKPIAQTKFKFGSPEAVLMVNAAIQRYIDKYSLENDMCSRESMHFIDGNVVFRKDANVWQAEIIDWARVRTMRGVGVPLHRKKPLPACPEPEILDLSPEAGCLGCYIS